MAKNLTETPTHFIEPKKAHKGSMDGMRLKVGIVCAKFNGLITKSLLMGALQGLKEHNVGESNIDTFWVPGAFEVPVVMAKKFENYDVMIAIACVIKGDTPHFDYVCQGITEGITMAVNDHKKPGIFCVLTTNNQKEAELRSAPNSTSNKGYEAAIAAIEMGNLI